MIEKIDEMFRIIGKLVEYFMRTSHKFGQQKNYH